MTCQISLIATKGLRRDPLFFDQILTFTAQICMNTRRSATPANAWHWMNFLSLQINFCEYTGFLIYGKKRRAGIWYIEMNPKLGQSMVINFLTEAQYYISSGLTTKCRTLVHVLGDIVLCLCSERKNDLLLRKKIIIKTLIQWTGYIKFNGKVVLIFLCCFCKVKYEIWFIELSNNEAILG